MNKSRMVSECNVNELWTSSERAALNPERVLHMSSNHSPNLAVRVICLDH